MTDIVARIIDRDGLSLSSVTAPSGAAALLPRLGETVEIRVGPTVRNYRVVDVVHEYDAGRNGDQTQMVLRIVVALRTDGAL